MIHLTWHKFKIEFQEESLNANFNFVKITFSKEKFLNEFH